MIKFLSCALLLNIFCCPALSRAEVSGDQPGLAVEAAQKEIVAIGPDGILPAQLVLTKEDASVFFVNTSADALLSLQVDFGKRRAHCASSNMSYDEKGLLKSSQPIGPKDFAIMCFPERGEYTVTVFGVGGSLKPKTGIISVR